MAEMFLMNTFCITYTTLIILVSSINTLPTIPFPIPIPNIGNITCKQSATITNHSRLACEQIAMNISDASAVYTYYDLRYYENINHYATSSIKYPACTVEPSTANDVVIIINAIRQYQVPFAVKSGGHSLNPGFSSTTGVLIIMKRFSQTVYHANNQTVDIGSGLFWDDVYQALEPYNVSILGGRVSGVGVGGFSLGGGYGWKSNQYGLTIDNINEYLIVTYNGSILYVNNQSYPDLYFGLKGGLNNFGIVLNFNVRALPQTPVYGGLLNYVQTDFDSVLRAVVNFQNTNTDPKASMLVSFTGVYGNLFLQIIIFYDAPTAPQTIFRPFLDIPHIGVLTTQSYLSFVKSSPIYFTENMRGRYHSLSVQNVTTTFLQKVKELAIIYTPKLFLMGGTLTAFIIEPFLPSYFKNSEDGAYPHVSSVASLLPVLVQLGWQSCVNDQYFINELQVAVNTLRQTAIQDSPDLAGSDYIIYPNYALENTPLTQMYGANVNTLKTTCQQWDPYKLLKLTEGFLFC